MDQGHHSWYLATLLLKVRVDWHDKLLLEHVGLPHILDHAVHLVNFFCWMDQSWYLATQLLKVRVDQ